MDFENLLEIELSQIFEHSIKHKSSLGSREVPQKIYKIVYMDKLPQKTW